MSHYHKGGNLKRITYLLILSVIAATITAATATVKVTVPATTYGYACPYNEARCCAVRVVPPGDYPAISRAGNAVNIGGAWLKPGTFGGDISPLMREVPRINPRPQCIEVQNDKTN